MRIVFLDFDGVLVTGKFHFALPDPDCVLELNRITDTAGPAIVVSSAWRVGRSLEDLQQLLLTWGVTAPVVGLTPPRAYATGGSILIGATRGQEIQAWLNEHIVDRHDFVILDDDNDMDGLHDRLVRTVFSIGLTAADADKAIALFGQVS